MIKSNITIHPFSKSDSISELTHLLHRSYKVLLDQGLCHVAGHQDDKTTEHHISIGNCFIAEQDGKMVGTILLYGDLSDKGDVPDLYKRKDVGVFGKFAVEPALQNLGIGSMLMDFIENIAREKGMTELALDTSEDSIDLIDYYKKRGYKFICNHSWKVTNFRSVVMSKKITNTKKLIIRPFCDKDSVAELTDLLHRAYKFLADMGLRFVATWQDEEITKRHVTKGECFIAELNGKMVGTILLYAKYKNDNTLPDWYRRDDVRVFGKFAVDPDYQMQGIGSRLLDYLEDYLKKKDLKELALDTSDKALHLIDYYKKRGYRFICTHQWPVVNYYSIVMSKTLNQKPNSQTQIENKE